MFVELYPHCTVIYSYPNSVRPPLPYVVLDFERIEPVNSFEYVKNGILWQEKCKRIPFSAELVTESKTEHAAGVNGPPRPGAHPTGRYAAGAAR